MNMKFCIALSLMSLFYATTILAAPADCEQPEEPQQPEQPPAEPVTIGPEDCNSTTPTDPATVPDACPSDYTYAVALSVSDGSQPVITGTNGQCVSLEGVGTMAISKVNVMVGVDINTVAQHNFASGLTLDFSSVPDCGDSIKSIDGSQNDLSASPITAASVKFTCNGNGVAPPDPADYSAQVGFYDQPNMLGNVQQLAFTDQQCHELEHATDSTGVNVGSVQFFDADSTTPLESTDVFNKHLIFYSEPECRKDSEGTTVLKSTSGNQLNLCDPNLADDCGFRPMSVKFYYAVAVTDSQEVSAQSVVDSFGTRVSAGLPLLLTTLAGILLASA